MKGSLGKVLLCGLLATVTSSAVLASPAIDSAVIHARVFNDNPDSTFAATNFYAASVTLRDEHQAGAGGWANRHNFRLSEDGGISDAVFNNGDGFVFSSDVRLTGTCTNIEGGLNFSPWWSQQVDGVFMLRPGDGEISCWGGRLPFYMFSSAANIDPNTGLPVRYALGTTARLSIGYDPNSLTEADPATITYTYTLYDPDGAGPMVGYSFSSPALPYDMGNPAENPPYGLWGNLNDGRVGGFVQIPVMGGGVWGMAEYGNMEYVPEPASLALLALGGLCLIQRRKH